MVTMDQNLGQTTNDLQKIQMIVNQLCMMVSELQEANKDILVGRRRLDCLSCGDKDYHTNQSQVNTISQTTAQTRRQHHYIENGDIVRSVPTEIQSGAR